MSDYKATLNLPKTDFPMKASLAQREPGMLEFWQKLDIYQKMQQQAKGRPRFILHDGPPYANGHLHLGHAVNKILKDIVVKSKHLSGFDTPYIPGWDCHGLPIELNVEKKLGKAGVNLSAKQFRQKCREYATSQVAIQSEEFQRLGILGDWQNPYLTMNPGYEAAIIRSLAKIVANGHLQPGYKPVHWCLDCQSALAEAEVEYQDKTSPAIDVRFRVLNDAALLAAFGQDGASSGAGPISIPIWTTTPWTLPANQAVALHPEINYSLVELETNQGVERLLLAESLLPAVTERLGVTDYRVVASGLGQALEGIACQHPFYNREVPVVLGEHVTVDAGTGAVHTAPAHGQEDYLVAQNYQLPVSHQVQANGVFSPDTELFAGEHVFKVNDHVIEVLKARGNLLHQARMQHSYPHCWRHKTPVIFRATAQWFISMDQQNLRRETLDEIFKVRFVPQWGQARIAGMIENRPDWCISRQRNWGVPIPLFIHKQKQTLHPDSHSLMMNVAKKVEQDGIDAWFDLDINEFLGAEAEEYRKVTDTLDVWFDSGVSHTAVLERRGLGNRADLYLEGSDQHRGWFHTALLTSVAMYSHAPYHQVLTHGFTVDADGRKMSKSLGNVIAPEKVIKQLGADILRLWVSAADYRSELTVSDEILKRTADTYRRIRNTARYLLANTFDISKEQLLEADQLLLLDKYILAKAGELQKELQTAYDNYQFHTVYQKLHHFCAQTLGGFYLDIIKDRQYTCATESVPRRSCQTAMYHLLQALVRWLAPILSFTAEEIWQHMPEKQHESVFLTEWYSAIEQFSLAASQEDFWTQLAGVRSEVNKALEQKRSEGIIRSGLDAKVTLFVSSALNEQLGQLGDELRFLLITSEARLDDINNAGSDAQATELGELKLQIEATAAEKCERCWHRREDVGVDKEHPTLCQRCVSNVFGQGEERHFA